METKASTTFEEPRFAKWLFASSQGAWIWLVVRFYLGYLWLNAGWGKLTGSEGGTWHWGWGMSPDSWLRDHGAALAGFVGFATSKPMTTGPHAANNFGWYTNFLHWSGTNASWMAWVITFGEIAIGVGLIVGCLTGIAAFFGATLSVSFGMAGVAGLNPLFLVLEMLLILAWRNAGYIGLDRYVLPALGTPWQPGRVFEHRHTPSMATT